MNLFHLKTLCETIDNGLHLSKAAHAVHRSQPALTRQIKQLEQELGIKLFERNRSRILSLTEQGAAIVPIARRMVNDAQDIARVSQEALNSSSGELTVATTHTLARYTLLPTIREFMARYRNVVLNFRQGTNLQCCDMVSSGAVDMAICSKSGERLDVVQIPCGHLERVAVVPQRHPLLRKKLLTLEVLAEFPMIVAEGDTGNSIVDTTFRKAGIVPRQILSAINADLSKGYVEMGIGVGVMVSVAFDSQRDHHLRSIPVGHLFPSTQLTVAMRPNTYLREYMLAFVQMYAPELSVARIRSALSRVCT